MDKNDTKCTSTYHTSYCNWFSNPSLEIKEEGGKEEGVEVVDVSITLNIKKEGIIEILERSQCLNEV